MIRSVTCRQFGSLPIFSATFARFPCWHLMCWGTGHGGELMKLKRGVCFIALAACLAWTTTAPVIAQQPKGEVSVLLGWSIADGVSGADYVTSEGIFNRID